jgi:CCR4-NOT transcription complex subunit 7/8
MDLSTLNPFKKKENEFNLNESSLPSLGSNDNNRNNNNSSDFNSDLPPIPNSDFSNNNNNDFSQTENNDFNSFDDSSMTPSFSQPQPDSEFKSKFSSDSLVSEPDLTPEINSSNNNSHSSSHSQQLSNAQMETKLAKMNLIEMKLNSMESKIDMISQILLEEVSDETKKKLKLKSMMDRVRN